MIFNMEDATMKKLFISFAALAALLSCVKETPQNEQESINQNTEVEGKVVSIIANAPSHVDANANSNKPQQSGTRTQLASDGKSVLWSPGDVVKVCFPPIRNWSGGHSGSTRYGYSTDFTSTATGMSATTCFQGNWTWSSSNSTKIEAVGFAVYPGDSERFKYSADATTSSGAIPTISISYDLPSVQEAIEGTFDNKLNLSYAALNRADMYSNTANASFKNVCALLKFNLPQEDYHIKSIKVETGNESGVVAGVANLEWQNSSSFLGLKPVSFNATPVTLQKSSNEELVPGASYYALIWPQNHNQLKITFTNADGNSCVKTLNTGSNIVCNAGECTTLNVKSLSFSTAPKLEVDTAPITTSYTGGTESLFVQANCPWTATSSNSAMITITESGASQLTFNVSQNAEPDARTANVTILYGNGDKKVITVTQNALTYRITGGVVTRAANLENGATYVIFYAGGSNNNQEQPYCWQVDGAGVVSRQYASDKNATFNRNRVFKFHKTSTLNGSWTSNGQDYRSACSGYLEAMYRNRYMVKSGSNLDFTATSTSGAVNLRFGNAWANETGSDIDVWVSTSETIYWTGHYLYWGGTGNTPRKWFFYKAVEN